MKQILETLEQGFKVFDDKSLEIGKAYFLKLKADFKAYQESDEHKEFHKQYARKDVWVYYEEMFRRCGGKTNYALIKESDARIVEIVTKSHFDKITKRNFKIAKKLTEANITSVLESKVAVSNDGFNGFFRVETNNGAKTVEINTVYAGGHNVQCLHCRVLVKIK